MKHEKQRIYLVSTPIALDEQIEIQTISEEEAQRIEEGESEIEDIETALDVRHWENFQEIRPTEQNIEILKELIRNLEKQQELRRQTK